MDSSSIETLSAISSSVSSPSPPMPFSPKYAVRFTSQVTKDGEVVLYTIKIIRVSSKIHFTILKRYDFYIIFM